MIITTIHSYHTLVCPSIRNTALPLPYELEFELLLVGSYQWKQTIQTWLFKVHCGNQGNVAYYLQSTFWQEISQHFTNEVSDSIPISPPKKWKGA